jgi:hypothetical protein
MPETSLKMETALSKFLCLRHGRLEYDRKRGQVPHWGLAFRPGEFDGSAGAHGNGAGHAGPRAEVEIMYLFPSVLYQKPARCRYAKHAIINKNYVILTKHLNHTPEMCYYILINLLHPTRKQKGSMAHVQYRSGNL